MTSSKTREHWGEWVKRRAFHLGIRRHKELALADGCTPTHLGRCLAKELPPASMRKGIDFNLANALQIIREMLLNDWKGTDPESVPNTSGVSTTVSTEASLRRKVQAIAELLSSDQLSELHDRGRELLSATSAA